MKKMKILLEGHEELLAKLEDFLCSYYHVHTGDIEEEVQPLKVVDSRILGKKVKVHHFRILKYED
jgi:hypothetical protein